MENTHWTNITRNFGTAICIINKKKKRIVSLCTRQRTDVVGMAMIFRKNNHDDGTRVVLYLRACHTI